MTVATGRDTDRQYRLPLTDEIRSFADLTVTGSNQAALAAIRQPDAWQSASMILIGPRRCGLGAIGQLWADETGGRPLSAAELDALPLAEVEQIALKNSVVDLAEKVQNEAHFLTLLNLSRSHGTRTLFTARTAPANWAFNSADLRSRLEATPVVEIYPPDEDMLRLRLLASCKRHFIHLNDNTVKFLSVRLPRSYLAIEDYVVCLDAAIETTGRAPTINLAKEVLEAGLGSYKLFDDGLE